MVTAEIHNVGVPEIDEVLGGDAPRGKVVVPDRAFFRERQQLALARLAETGVVRSGQPTGQRVAR